MEKEIETLKQKLLKEKERLEKEKKNINKLNDYGSSEDDNVYEYEEREERLGLGKKVNTLLTEVDLALKNIDEGKYGLCQSCGGKIELGRLKIYPTAINCSTCAIKRK